MGVLLMQHIFSLTMLVAFVVESAFFIIMTAKGNNVADSYFQKYKEKNLFLFTVVKGTIVALIIYIIYHPGGLVLGSGRIGAYIVGILYGFISVRFVWNCRKKV